jgi:uncharacterized protein (TIGR03435 family)
MRRVGWWIAPLGVVTMAALHAGGQLAAKAEPLAFEVASVRQDKSGDAPFSNFPLNSGPQYAAKGGLLQAHNMPLLQFLVFAYKPDMYQIQLFRSKLPDWARSARFDIEAHADSSRSKDDLRLMMQTLLAERFHLVMRHEVREVPAYGLELVKPGRTGPELKVHGEEDCAGAQLPAQMAGAYPVQCGSAASVAPRVSGDYAIAGYNMPMGEIAKAVGGGGDVRDRPVVDQTGLAGRFDFHLEWTEEANLAAQDGGGPPVLGTTFAEALREQLGFKLVSSVTKTEVLVLEHAELPTEN